MSDQDVFEVGERVRYAGSVPPRYGVVTGKTRLQKRDIGQWYETEVRFDGRDQAVLIMNNCVFMIKTCKHSCSNSK